MNYLNPIARESTSPKDPQTTTSDLVQWTYGVIVKQVKVPRQLRWDWDMPGYTDWNNYALSDTSRRLGWSNWFDILPTSTMIVTTLGVPILGSLHPLHHIKTPQTTDCNPAIQTNSSTKMQIFFFMLMWYIKGLEWSD